jgi:Protein of unknown function (DUF 659)
VQILKAGWETTGVTVTSDGWSDTCNRPLLNILGVSPTGEVFIAGMDSTGHAKTGRYVADKLIEAIEKIGPEHVVQVSASTNILEV